MEATAKEDVQMEPQEAPAGREPKQFAGLGNQGATCYMNSLLQGLFITPEFRRMLYRWQYDPMKNADKKDCIPYQLSKLFASLQILQAKLHAFDDEQKKKAEGLNADSDPNKVEAERDEKAQHEELDWLEQVVYSRYADTTELTGSFQWDYHEGMQQQDIQEFWMQLFDAIELTMEQNGIYGSIDELFKGTNSDFIKCLTCNFESKHTSKFYNLILAIQDPFENINHNNLIDALRGLLKVETLTGDNKYACQECPEKQDADKGTKFVDIPKILMLQLNRFTLDMVTFNRKKIIDPVAFPPILNINPFLDQKNVSDEKFTEMIKENPLAKVATQMKKSNVGFMKRLGPGGPRGPASRAKAEKKESKVDEPVKGQETTQAESQEQQPSESDQPMEMNDTQKSFQQQLEQELGCLNVVEDNEPKVAKGAHERMLKRQQEQAAHRAQLKKMREAKKARQATLAAGQAKFGARDRDTGFMANIKKAKEQNQGWALDFENPNQTQDHLIEVKEARKLTEQEQLDRALADSMKDAPAGGDATKPSDEAKKDAADEKPKEPAAKLSQKEMEQLIFKETIDLRLKYLQDGPFVYELYGVMLHKGGAYGGHYNAFLKDLEVTDVMSEVDREDNWYLFNDSVVSKISVTELADAFGGNHNLSNAYMLMYRLVEPGNEKNKPVNMDEIPEEVKHDVIEKLAAQRTERAQKLEEKRKMMLKVVRVRTKVDANGTLTDEFEEAEHQLVLRVDRHVDTYDKLFDMVLKEYFPDGTDNGVPIDRSQFRIRAFNVQFKILMDTYEGRGDLTMDQLKIYPMKTLALEQKPTNEAVFQPYDPNKMEVKINLWSPTILEQHLSLQDFVENAAVKIRVARDMPFIEFKLLLEAKFGFKDAVIMRRTPMSQDKDVDVLTDHLDEVKLTRGLNELKVNEGVNLYVEEKVVDGEKHELKDAQTDAIFETRWQREFDIEKNSFHIRYNKPVEKEAEGTTVSGANIYTESVVIDRRLLVEDLKKKIAEQLGESLDGIIFKRGGAFGAEMVEDDLPFKLANVFNMMSIYIERGQPTRAGYKRLRYSLAEYYNPNWMAFDERLPYDHEFFTFTELFSIPTRTLDKVKDVKAAIMPKLLELYPQLGEGNIKIRLRERLADKLCAVYHDERVFESYQMHDDKEVSIQVLREGVDPDYDLEGSVEREDMHYALIKLWHPKEWTLDLPTEVWVSKRATIREFAAILSSTLNIPSERIMCSKVNSPWNFHRVELPYLEWMHLCPDHSSEDSAMKSTAASERSEATKQPQLDISSNFLSTAPFYMQTDGILFVVRDSAVEMREMTKDEKDMYRCEEFEERLMAGGKDRATGAGGKPKKPAEAGVKITVVSKADQIAQQEQLLKQAEAMKAAESQAKEDAEMKQEKKE